MDGLLGVAGALGSTTIWAYSLVLFERGLAAYGAFTCNLFKACVGAALFWLVVAGFGAAGDAGFGSAEGAWMLLASGVFGMAFGDYAYFACIGHLGVRQATLLQGTTPVFLLAWTAAMPGERLGPWQLVGVLLVAGGVSAVTWVQRSRRERPDGDVVKGWTWGLTAAAGQAVGIVMADRALDEYALTTGAAVRLSGAIAGLVILQLLRRRLRATLAVLFGAQVWKALVVPSVLGTFVGIFCMMAAIRYCPPAVAGALLATTPITILPFAWVMRGQKAGPMVIAATCVAVAGVAMVSAALAG